MSNADINEKEVQEEMKTKVLKYKKVTVTLDVELFTVIHIILKMFDKKLAKEFVNSSKVKKEDS